ncbi:MAG TPA: hypothetical protein VF492_03645, partial [Verrucomicrobiae bacterium]
MKFLALRLAFTAASAAAPRITAFNAADTLTWTNATVPGVSTVETATAQNREAFWRFQFHAHLAAGLVVLSRVGGADGLRGTRPMTVSLRPSSNRTGGFPASGF